MLAEFRNMVFNCEIKGESACLWKYVPVEGFDRKFTRRGVVYYEKTVNLKDMSVPFFIEFFVLRDGLTFSITDFRDGQAKCICGNSVYAENHGFTEMERGVWMTCIPIRSFDEVIMEKRSENPFDCRRKTLSIGEFEKAWEYYRRDV